MVNHPHQRRGSIYIGVLCVSAIVAAMGLGLLYTVRLEGVASRAVADGAAARLCAEAGVDAVAQIMSADSTWRNRAAGTWVSNMRLGAGSVTVQVLDPDDGNLADSASDPVLLRCQGSAGSAVHLLEVTLASAGMRLSCLDGAVMAGSTTTGLNFGPATVNSNAVMATNGPATSSGTVNGPVEAALVAGGTGVYTPAARSNVPLRTMPDPVSTVNYFVAQGTNIPLSAIPKAGQNYVIDGQLLARGLNSFAPSYTNGDGIYVISLGGANINIKSTRVYGTLVLLEPGVNSSINNSFNAGPTDNRPNYPCLIVRGNFTIAMTATTLSEATLGRNLNPSNAPYAGFSQQNDSDMTDVYPSVIAGLVYVTGDLTTQSSTSINGAVVIGGALNCTGSLTVTLDPRYRSDPPPGFAVTGNTHIYQGSWRQAVLP